MNLAYMFHEEEETTQATKDDDAISLSSSESEEEFEDSEFQNEYNKYKYTIGEDNDQMLNFFAKVMKKK